MDEANVSLPGRANLKPARAAVRIFLVAGEHSGDQLGAKLMAALERLRPDHVVFAGVGGEAMTAQGLNSLFALADVAVMGPVAILRRLPKIVARVYQVVDAALAFRPDVVVIIDSPEFTHPIAKRIARRAPHIPIVDYVSPTVWAWRPGRARKMRRTIDHVLALLPFEPAAHERLGGPPCTYVGHALAERLAWIAGLDPDALAKRLGLEPGRPVIVVLPGSRPSEVSRLIGPFGEAVGTVAARAGPLHILMPTVPSVRHLLDAGTANWPAGAGTPHLIEGEDDKFRAFRLARVALAASGTVTLELAASGTPMVVAYKVEPLATVLRYMIKAPSIVLANLVLGRNAFPEFIQENCTGPKLADALITIMHEGQDRAQQLAALAEIPGLLRVNGSAPSEAAATVVLDYGEGRLQIGHRD